MYGASVFFVESYNLYQTFLRFCSVFCVNKYYVFLYCDLVVIAETEDDLIRRLNEWKDNVETEA